MTSDPFGDAHAAFTSGRLDDLFERLGGPPVGPEHLLPCGCLRTDRGAHRRACPDFETIETDDPAARGLDRYRWIPREKD